jgi:hypothetical protein
VAAYYVKSLCICCILCVLVVPYVYLLYYVCTDVLTLDAGLLAKSQYPEGLATGHLDTGFSWFPCVYKRMMRWFPSFQVANTCLSCSPPDLNFLVTFFIFVYMQNNHCHRVITQLQLINIIKSLVVCVQCTVQSESLMLHSAPYTYYQGLGT